MYNHLVEYKLGQDNNKRRVWGPISIHRKKERRMSYLLPHLHSGWAVDQAILAEEERLVVIRFGHDWDETCMQVKQTNPISLFFNSIHLYNIIILLINSFIKIIIAYDISRLLASVLILTLINFYMCCFDYDKLGLLFIVVRVELILLLPCY